MRLGGIQSTSGGIQCSTLGSSLDIQDFRFESPLSQSSLSNF